MMKYINSEYYRKEIWPWRKTDQLCQWLHWRFRKFTKNSCRQSHSVTMVRSATSPALHYGEAQSAESRNDFIHKMKVCLKELRETYNCLRLIKKKNWYNEAKLQVLITENNELISIFVSSLKTAQKNRKWPEILLNSLFDILLFDISKLSLKTKDWPDILLHSLFSILLFDIPFCPIFAPHYLRNAE